MVIFWGSLPNEILTILLTLSGAVFTVIFTSKYKFSGIGTLFVWEPSTALGSVFCYFSVKGLVP